ncbi:hypothetical protein Tco_0397367 [Tanacetum coccineum]
MNRHSIRKKKQHHGLPEITNFVKQQLKEKRVDDGGAEVMAVLQLCQAIVTKKTMLLLKVLEVLEVM